MEWLIGVCLDGLMPFLYGPFKEKINNVRMFHDSKLQFHLGNFFENKRLLYLFGDKAFKYQRFVMSSSIDARAG